MRTVPASRLRLAASILCLVLALPLCASAQDAAPKEPMGSLVFTMSTDDAALFDAAMLMGTVALKRGHEVVMLLRVDAIKPALASASYPVGDTTLDKKLAAFMQAGATVIAGGGCMKLMGLKKTDLIPGVVVGTPDIVMGALFKDGSKIISY